MCHKYWSSLKVFFETIVLKPLNSFTGRFMLKTSFYKETLLAKKDTGEKISLLKVFYTFIYTVFIEISHIVHFFFFFLKVGYLFLKNVRRINYTLARKRKMICWCLKKYTDDFLVKIIQNWLKPIIIKNRPKEIKIHLWLE